MPRVWPRYGDSRTRIMGAGDRNGLSPSPRVGGSPAAAGAKDGSPPSIAGRSGGGSLSPRAAVSPDRRRGESYESPKTDSPAVVKAKSVPNSISPAARRTPPSRNLPQRDPVTGKRLWPKLGGYAPIKVPESFRRLADEDTESDDEIRSPSSSNRMAYSVSPTTSAKDLTDTPNSPLSPQTAGHEKSHRGWGSFRSSNMDVAAPEVETTSTYRAVAHTAARQTVSEATSPQEQSLPSVLSPGKGGKTMDPAPTVANTPGPQAESEATATPPRSSDLGSKQNADRDNGGSIENEYNSLTQSESPTSSQAGPQKYSKPKGPEPKVVPRAEVPSPKFQSRYIANYPRMDHEELVATKSGGSSVSRSSVGVISVAPKSPLSATEMSSNSRVAESDSTVASATGLGPDRSDMEKSLTTTPPVQISNVESEPLNYLDRLELEEETKEKAKLINRQESKAVQEVAMWKSLISQDKGRWSNDTGYLSPRSRTVNEPQAVSSVSNQPALQSGNSQVGSDVKFTLKVTERVSSQIENSQPGVGATAAEPQAESAAAVPRGPTAGAEQTNRTPSGNRSGVPGLQAVRDTQKPTRDSGAVSSPLYGAAVEKNKESVLPSKKFSEPRRNTSQDTAYSQQSNPEILPVATATAAAATNESSGLVATKSESLKFEEEPVSKGRYADQQRAPEPPRSSNSPQQESANSALKPVDSHRFVELALFPLVVVMSSSGCAAHFLSPDESSYLCCGILIPLRFLPSVFWPVVAHWMVLQMQALSDSTALKSALVMNCFLVTAGMSIAALNLITSGDVMSYTTQVYLAHAMLGMAQALCRSLPTNDRSKDSQDSRTGPSTTFATTCFLVVFSMSICSGALLDSDIMDRTAIGTLCHALTFRFLSATLLPVVGHWVMALVQVELTCGDLEGAYLRVHALVAAFVMPVTALMVMSENTSRRNLAFMLHVCIVLVQFCLSVFPTLRNFVKTYSKTSTDYAPNMLSDTVQGKLRAKTYSRARRSSGPTVMENVQDVAESFALAWSTGAFSAVLGPMIERVFGLDAVRYCCAFLGAVTASIMTGSAVLLVTRM